MEWLENILEDVDIENKESVMEEIKKKIGENFVPNNEYKKKTSKIEQLDSELNTAKDQLDKMNDQVEKLEKKAENAEEFKEQLENIKEEYKEYQEQEEERINNIKTRNALEKNLLSDNVPEDLVDLVADDFDLDNLKLDDEGNLLNYESQREQAKEKRPSAFAQEKITGDGPQDGDKGKITDNPFKPGNVNLTKQAELLEEKPDTAKRMIKAAGLKLSDYGLD